MQMFLALREMRRAKVRFGLLIAAIGLLVFLILFQQSLQNSLLRGFTGAIRAQSAPVLVYSTDGQRTLQASVLTPELEELARSADGVGEAGLIAQGTFTVTAADEVVEAAIIGYETEGLGSPDDLTDGRLPSTAGEAVASDEDAGAGFDLGDTVVIEPGGAELTVVGLAADAQLNVGPTLFVTYDTYVDAVAARNPDAGEPLPNALGVVPDASTSLEQLVPSINAESDDLDALTRDQAADEAPGVAQVRQSFRVIFCLYGLVVPFVTGLFFLIVTFQKAASLTLLRAIGTSGRRLVSALLVQVLIIDRARTARRHRPVHAAHDGHDDGAGPALRDRVPSPDGRSRCSCSGCSARCSRPGVCWVSIRPRQRRWEVFDEVRPAGASAATGAVRHGDRDPHPRRRARDVPRWSARRADPVLDQRRASAGRRSDGLLEDGPIVVPRSRIDGDLRSTIESVDGVARHRRARCRATRRPGARQRTA